MELTNWHKSTRSGNQGNCVEVGHTPARQLVGIRDTKDPGPTIVVDRSSWQSFLSNIKAGMFD